MPLPTGRRPSGSSPKNFHQPQITLACQALIGDRQRLIEANGILAEKTAPQHVLIVANPQLRLGYPGKEDFHIARVERRVNHGVEFGVCLLVLDRDSCLLKHPVSSLLRFSNFGAGDEDRTRDQQLGRL
jgi:hypothetical protein